MSETAGYFDLQINGYAGVDFQSDTLSAEDFHRACVALRAAGTTGFLATIITDEIPLMERRLRRIVDFRERDPMLRELIPGIHIEGPFLNPQDGFRGAHHKAAIRPADRDSMCRLLDAAGGLAQIVTLAPENDPGMAVTRLLAAMGIRVSAGHTNASIQDLKAAIDAGLTMFTHLGNGCPMNLPRHDNIVQRALSLSDKLWLMFIADGAHVAFPALNNYLRAAGLEKCIVVTDAVAPAGKGPGRFKIGRWDLLIGDDLVARAPDGSHLVGSAIPMPFAIKRLVEQVGLTREQALRLTVHNPRKAMGYECECSECGDRGPGEERVGHPRTNAPSPEVQVFIPRGSGERQPTRPLSGSNQ